MRTLELVIGVILAVLVFVVLKLIGLVVKFALIAAVPGFVLGLALGRMLRRPG